MTGPAPESSEEPDGAPRLAVLDVLRGIAILGILFMNVNDMGGSMFASFWDRAHLGWTEADRLVWWVREVFAAGTARGLLEMLFGAGMVILTERLAAAGEWAALRRYYWRNAVLFAFGLVHVGLLLWPGDILHSYALAALLIFPCRYLRVRQLIVLGLSLATLQLASGLIDAAQGGEAAAAYQAAHARQVGGGALSQPDREALRWHAREDSERAARAAMIAEEDAARSGTAAEWARQQWRTAAWLQANGIEIWIVWEAAAAMLLGAALFRLGILQGHRSRRWYGAAMLGMYAVALALRVPAASAALGPDGVPAAWDAVGEFGRLAMTAGHMLFVNWLLTGPYAARWLAPFRAAGQTALSLYVAQTLVMLWLLFPPFGLGLYGRFGWGALMALALGVDVALLLLANIWMRHFRIAPVEWAWRSIVAGRRLPFRRARPAG